MIGVYDYTVILTYLSLLSAGTGIVVSLSGSGHPYWGVFFLLLCGFLDAFDGKVARTKKNRTSLEKSFGIQIDSLSDLVAFGVLPAMIGIALLRTSPVLGEAGLFDEKFFAVPWWAVCLKLMFYAILLLYMLAALIRLAYFNVTEEERQRTESGARKYFLGVPVTSSALIFPTVLLLRYVLPIDISIAYVPVALILGIFFVLRIRVPKPGTKGLIAFASVGLLECIAFVLCLLLRS